MRKTIVLAIDNLIKEGITDVELFASPFELKFLEIENAKKQIIDEVKKQIESAIDEESPKKKLNYLKVKKIGSVLIPKKELSDFRKCALIDPIDEIKYLTITLLMVKEIEKARIIKSRNKVFSYRYSPKNRYLFDNEYNYTKFRNYVSGKSKKQTIKVVVECDISNFYDRLNLHRLESNLKAIPKIDFKYVELLNELLLYWANRDSYGLPVGSNASRILAEASLIEVDNYLISKKIDFCRFVDDYRIFAKNAAEAHNHLSLLVEKLSKEGLFLNMNKTKIKDVSYLKNKRVKEENQEKKLEEIKKYLDGVSNFHKIIRGYSGLIPTKFKEMNESEKEKLVLENEDEMLNNLEKSIIIDPEEIKKTIKVIIASEKYELLGKVALVLKKFPQFLPYLIDVLLKYQEKISEETSIIIKEEFAKWFGEENVQEYILVYLTRFFKEGKFKDKEVLFNYFRNLKRNAGNYVGRAVLEALENNISRGELLEIRDYYVRADI
jgi:hypothetical protein